MGEPHWFKWGMGGLTAGLTWGHRRAWCGQWDRAPQWDASGQELDCPASEGVWSGRVGVAPRRLSEAGTPGGRAQTQRDWRPAWRDARGKKGNLEGAGAQWRRI